MSLALHGKSRRRQGTLVLATLLAVITAVFLSFSLTNERAGAQATDADEWIEQLNSFTTSVPPEGLCSGVDFNWVVDGSSSIDDDEWDSMTAGMVEFSQTYTAGGGDGAHTLTTFQGTSADIVLGSYVAPGVFEDTIDDLDQPSGSTPTSAGINAGISLGHGRPVPGEVMLAVSDGAPNEPDGGGDGFDDPETWLNAANAAITSANAARADGFHVIAIFIGEGDENLPFGDEGNLAWTTAVMQAIGGGVASAADWDAVAGQLLSDVGCDVVRTAVVDKVPHPNSTTQAAAFPEEFEGGLGIIPWSTGFDGESGPHNLDAGDVIFTEDAVDGWTFVGFYVIEATATCGTDPALYVGANGDPFPIADDDELRVCVMNQHVPSASVVVDKVPFPGDEPDALSTFEGTVGGIAWQTGFAAITDPLAVEPSATVVFNEAAPGAWSFVGYQVIDASEDCPTVEDDYTAANGSSFELLDGENLKVCVMNELQTATIAIIKDAIPNHQQDFTFDYTAPDVEEQFQAQVAGSFTLDDDSGAVGADNTWPNVRVFEDILPGDYTVLERLIFGWELEMVECLRNGEAMTFDIIQENGSAGIGFEAFDEDVIVCRFTNTAFAQIQVMKNADDGQVADNTETFTASITGPTNIPSVSFSEATPSAEQDVVPGIYTVTELAKEGWAVFGYYEGEAPVDPCAEPNWTGGVASNITVNPGDLIVVCFFNEQVAELDIIKRVDPGVINPGDELEYTVVVTNPGPSPAQNVVVSDTLPGAASIVWTVDPDAPGLCDLSSDAAGTDPFDANGGDTVYCSFGDIPGDTSRTIIITGTTAEDACAPYLNRGTVTWDNAPGPPPDPGNSAAQVAGGSAESNPVAVFCTLSPGNLQIRKYVDLDGDRELDPGDTLDSGWSMQVVCATEGTSIDDTFVTGADPNAVGEIIITDIPNGSTCTITEDVVSKPGFLPRGHLFEDVNGSGESESNIATVVIDDDILAQVDFSNQPTGSIVVNKETLSEGVADPSQNGGWHITVASEACGVELTADTVQGNPLGTVTFSGLPVCDDYVVSEDVGSKGLFVYTAVGPTSVDGVTPSIDDPPEVTFVNDLVDACPEGCGPGVPPPPPPVGPTNTPTNTPTTTTTPTSSPTSTPTGPTGTVTSTPTPGGTLAPSSPTASVTATPTRTGLTSPSTPSGTQTPQAPVAGTGQSAEPKGETHDLLIWFGLAAIMSGFAAIAIRNARRR